MDYLIFSDSHGHYDRMNEVLQRQVTRPAAVFFSGDGLRDLDHLNFGDTPLYAVSGNCDWFVPSGAFDTERIVALEQHTAFLTHGHTYSVKGGVGALVVRAAQVGADIVLFGHTHQPCLEVIPTGELIGGVTLRRPMYLFNPGSIGSDGSFGTLTLRRGDVLFSHGQV